MEFLRAHPFLFRFLKVVAKRGRFIYKPIRKIYLVYKSLLPDMYYHNWASANEDECFVDKGTDNSTLISVVVPTYNTLQTHLLEMVYSVINQHYENWELILVNASDIPDRREAVAACATIDKRIKIVDPGGKTGIAGNTNAGIRHASGAYIAFLDHDDLLHPCALHTVAAYIEDHKPGILYSDEDKINHHNTLFFEPHCKPRWSPDLMRNVNYMNHLTVIRREHLEQVQGLRPSFDGAQDFDLLWRIIDKCDPMIYHIPKILYHWRAADSSTARNIQTKQYIFEAGSKTLQEHLNRNAIPAKAKLIRNKPGFYKVLYEPVKKFSIVIGPVEVNRQRACAQWLEELLEEVDSKQIEQIELVIGAWYRKYAGRNNKLLKFTYVESVKKYWPAAAKLVSNKVIICFQEAALPKGKNDLRELASTALHNPAFAVAPVIIGPDKIIIDAGFVEADFGLQRLFAGYKLGVNSYFGTTDWVRDVMGLTMEVFAMRPDVFSKLTKVVKGSKITAFDLHLVYKDSPSDEPMCVLWSHTAFVYQGVLYFDKLEDLYFNIQLSQAAAYINMKVSSWGEFSERAE